MNTRHLLMLLMAPADKGGNGGNTAPAKTNRFDAIFGQIGFKPASATAKTYEENGRKSRKLATVLVELGTTRTFVEGKIQAVQNGSNKPVAEFLWFAAQNRGQCLKLDDPGAQRDMEAYKAKILAAYVEWRKGSADDATPTTSAAVQLDDITL